ncbi:MAG TPA: hypothetical protein VGP90_08810 [Acidimicrobiia bacterium]|jgi:hypothetical protein|nr:hypothetical protein [Acidimicrobiia bacterium]
MSFDGPAEAYLEALDEWSLGLSRVLAGLVAEGRSDLVARLLDHVRQLQAILLLHEYECQRLLSR